VADGAVWFCRLFLSGLGTHGGPVNNPKQRRERDRFFRRLIILYGHDAGPLSVFIRIFVSKRLRRLADPSVLSGTPGWHSDTGYYAFRTGNAGLGAA